ncbi:hypothetical protein [Silvibacterium dinghuense]|uniref:Tetratricopeptide repeat protein n=1 Tax=Silvibacterium dinghuense TaxID=1560006 RepID=A0A4Q1SFY2_9BACT|nr:hypothetical protein [Silvibacterium dinghuense]RXS96468.1 hypothetical protein ESZ00_00450 [Silvibacterium dinghuense]GGG91004.1 hypothetical protein GCM10011586_01950 [Silvibacterium dinghuense]
MLAVMPRYFPSLACFLLTGLLLTSSASPELRAQAVQNPDVLVAAHDWPGLAAMLQSSSHEAPEGRFYRGLLLEHEGQFEASRAELTPLLAELAQGSDRRREALARMALAEDAARLFDSKAAGEEFAAVRQCCAAVLTEVERTRAESGAAIYPLLAGTPAMTLEKTAGLSVPLGRTGSGLREATVYVDGHASRWLFAPAAPLAVLSHAQAKTIGLKTLGAVPITGRGDKPMAAEVAVIPQLRFGGALFRTVPVLLCSDEALPDGVDGVLPLPLLAMLGTITATDDDHLRVRDTGIPADGAALFEEDGQLLAETTDGMLFAIDPVKLTSALSPRLKPAAGAKDGNLTLHFGPVEADFLQLGFSKNESPTSFAGTLGDDALDQLAGYSFDFHAMRFTVQVHPQ